MKFLFESSLTPIYQSIINNLVKTLIEFKYEAISMPLKPDISTLNKINTEKPDFVVITNFSGVLTLPVEGKNKLFFEYLNTNLIFIHHDDIFHRGICIEDNLMCIDSFKSTKQRSWHFCIEPRNCLDLKLLGLENIYSITHASEFSRLEQSSPTSQFDLSFVGHIVPPIDLNRIFNQAPFSHKLHLAYWDRVCKLSNSVEKIAQECTEHGLPNAGIELSTAFKSLLITQLHSVSQYFRGDIIKRLKDYKLQIFGGDPSYLNSTEEPFDRKLQKDNLQYFKPIDRNTSAHVFSNSKINLNITSLQFDKAVINRVIDIGMLGGFVLTDYKEDLKKVTSVSGEISYDSIEELNSKIDYYLAHDKERIEISKQFQDDVNNKFTYKKVVENLLSKLAC